MSKILKLNGDAVFQKGKYRFSVSFEHARCLIFHRHDRKWENIFFVPLENFANFCTWLSMVSEAARKTKRPGQEKRIVMGVRNSMAKIDSSKRGEPPTIQFSKIPGKPRVWTAGKNCVFKGIGCIESFTELSAVVMVTLGLCPPRLLEGIIPEEVLKTVEERRCRKHEFEKERRFEYGH